MFVFRRHLSAFHISISKIKKFLVCFVKKKIILKKDGLNSELMNEKFTYFLCKDVVL